MVACARHRRRWTHDSHQPHLQRSSMAATVNRLARRVLLLLVYMLCFALSSSRVRATEPTVTLTVSPTALEVCPQLPANSQPSAAGRALVVIRNETDSPIRQICITGISNGPVRHSLPNAGAAVCSGLKVPQIEGKSSFSTPLDVALSGYPTTTATIHLYASYEGGDKAKPVNAIATGSLDVKAVPIPDADGVKLETKVA